MDYESVTERLRAMVCILDREADGEIRPTTALAGIRREVAAALSDTESKDLLSRARLSLCNYVADLRGDARRIGPPEIEIGVVERLISDIEATAKQTESKDPGMSLRAHLEMAIGLSMVCAEPDVTDALRDVVAILDRR